MCYKFRTEKARMIRIARHLTHELASAAVI